jgi:tetratricopeptide (TPR) repeat protein
MPLAPLESREERIERLFHQALEIEIEDREGFFARAADRDDQFAVQRLLDAHARVGKRAGWSAPAIQNEAFRAAPGATGATLDRYRLLEPVGGGGTGTVYKAVRADDEFSKLVAIKILHFGGEAERDATVRRFRQERQILAGLEHPNIGRLLDGGSTPDGLPFLVMDYVDGVPIDRYLAEKKPPIRAILELFRKVCSAVSHAHQNLIVHRDLKPGNILVTADGTPKLLDFGIAKLLDGSAERTRTGAGAMTPEYASPEQVRGAATTTATDIYSLGVLLYELLCGLRPYRATTSTMELAQAICSETPAPMSARTGKRFDPDLENIVQMALRKEPERRYASVEQFSEDLRRYLEGYPVAARAATREYRARRFAGRNKASIAAAAIILFTLIGGIAATAWQARVANQRFGEVRDLANSYLFEFHDAIKDLPGSTLARQLVVKRGLQYLDRLARQRGTDPALGQELADAYQKVGAVQGAPNTSSLGDRTGAMESYRKELALRESLAAAAPKNIEIGTGLSGCYVRIGQLLQLAGDLKGAAAIEGKAVRLMEKLLTAQPASFAVRDSLAEAYTLLGNVTGNNQYPNLGDAKEAMSLYQKARHIREKLVEENPTKRDQRMFLNEEYVFIANIQEALDNKEASVASFRQALAGEERLLREDPANTRYRRDAATTYRAAALVLVRTGNLEEATKFGDRSAELFERLAKDDPADVEAQIALADSYYSQGYFLQKANDAESALKHYESAISVYSSVMATHPDIQPAGLRTVYQLMAELGIKTGDTGMALRSAQKELDIDDRLLAANPANAGAQRNQGVAYTQIGQVHEKLASSSTAPVEHRIREWREARSWYQRGLDVWLVAQAKGTLIPMYVSKLEEGNHNVAKCNRALGASSRENRKIER